MPLTQTEFEAACKHSCPWCAQGNAPRYRAETLEWTHDFTGKGSFSHTFCLASGLRKAYDQGHIAGKPDPVGDGLNEIKSDELNKRENGPPPRWGKNG